MNNFNYQLNKLESEIIQVLQQSQMPVGVYYLLMSKITKDLEQMYNQQIQAEAVQNQPTEDVGDKHFDDETPIETE